MIPRVAVTEWIPISPTLDQLESQADSQGRQLYLSPYDVPRAVRGLLDPGSGLFRIEFKYIDSEPLIVWRAENGALALELGKYSERVYALQINLSSFPQMGAGRATFVRDCVRKALQHKASTGDKGHRDGYLLARELLTSNHAPAAGVFTPLEAR